MKQVKKTIADLVLKGDNAYTVKDLAMHIYDIELDDIERRHTTPVVRAMKKLVEEHPKIEIYRSYEGGSGTPMVILDVTSPMAHAMQQGKTNYWYNKIKPPGWKAGNYWQAKGSESDIIKGIKQKDLKKGSLAYDRADIAKAHIDGDEEKIAQHNKERAEAFAALAAEFKADRPAPTVDAAIKAIKVLYEYHLTMDNDDGLTYEH